MSAIQTRKGHKAMTEPQLQEPTFAAGYQPGAPDTDEAKPRDYFAFSQTKRFTLPDGIQWVEFRKMNEGEKKEFQDRTSTDMVVERRSGDARMTIKQGTQRHELIKACVVGWNLFRGDPPQPVPFTKVNLGDFLHLADPTLIEELEKAIRKENPWLLADMSEEDIKREISNLEEMLEEKRKNAAGEAS